ncbi:MAG: 4Fe-4S binding protein [Deltaproteobacteria bacterium]|nr:4Fe-4S binding protein [Deltaproteobacteria bacterium]
MIPVEGSEYDVPCDTLIFAIGQSRMLEILPEPVEITGKHTTSNARVFVSGDFAYGSLDVIHAVADAKEAALEMDEYLMGEKRRAKSVEIRLLEDQMFGTGRLRDMDLAAPPVMDVLSVVKRARDEEVDRGFDDEQTRIAAQRCYLCNYKYEIDQDRCIHCDWCMKVMPRDCIHRTSFLFRGRDGADEAVDTPIPREATYIWIDSDECIRCGACLRICPTEAITVRKTDSQEHVTAVEYLPRQAVAHPPRF